MEKNILASISYKRKRKSSFEVYREDESCNKKDSKEMNCLAAKDNYDSYSDSSNSTTPLFSGNLKYREYETSSNSSFSSDVTNFKSQNTFLNMETKEINGSLHYKPEALGSYKLMRSNDNSEQIDTTQNEEYLNNEKTTFRVDMSRFNCFNTSTANVPSKINSLHFNSDFSNSFDSNTYRATTPLLLGSNLLPKSAVSVRDVRNRSHIYKPHRHNKNITVSYVPCKGPACTSQICCAHFCSQKCYDNQKWPIGSSVNFRTSFLDYDSCSQPEINVTDYGLPYPDHTYCRDHKNIYFNADPNIDCPPYFELVESIFYDEKESRIKNPMPIPNFNGDPISSNGYVSHTTKRGRPKRSNVVGLLNSYIFHPSSEVTYVPFVFKESIVEADRLSQEIKSREPIVHALRQSSSLYKDLRSDIPKDVLYDNAQSDHMSQSEIFDDMMIGKPSNCSADLPVIDDLFRCPSDDFGFK